MGKCRGQERDNETVSFEGVEVVRETDKALLVLLDGDEHWIPKGQIDDSSEVFSQASTGGRLVITAWIAEKKGLL